MKQKSENNEKNNRKEKRKMTGWIIALGIISVIGIGGASDLV